MQRKIGAHVSASGGLEKAIERAYALGANCAQIFSGSPRVWRRAELSLLNTEKMFSKRKELHVEPIFTHSLYLVNLASQKPDLLQKSFAALAYDLEFDSLIQGSGIIVHLGSHLGLGFDSVKEQVASQIALLLAQTPHNSTFLIENSAGQKGKLCSDLAEIAWLFKAVGEKVSQSGQTSQSQKSVQDRLGWCLDTCHAHAAGYALGDLAREISKLGLWEKLRCIHVNDSRDPFASGRDRHENLGTGTVPAQDLQTFLARPELAHIPLILEVPGFDGNGPDKQNVEYLTKLSKTHQ